MNPYYPHLFQPLTIKNVTFRNRLFVAPHMMSHMDFTGRPRRVHDRLLRGKRPKAATPSSPWATPVDREHAATNPRSFAVTPENSAQAGGDRPAIHAGGALASRELNHGGKIAFAEANNGGEGWKPGARWRSTRSPPRSSTATRSPRNITSTA